MKPQWLTTAMRFSGLRGAHAQHPLMHTPCRPTQRLRHPDDIFMQPIMYPSPEVCLGCSSAQNSGCQAYWIPKGVLTEKE